MAELQSDARHTREHNDPASCTRVTEQIFLDEGRLQSRMLSLKE